jgi:hypothetical protein
MQCSLLSCNLVPLRLKGLFQHPIHKHSQPMFLIQLESPSVTLIQKSGKTVVLFILIFMFLDSICKTLHRMTESIPWHPHYNSLKTSVNSERNILWCHYHTWLEYQDDAKDHRLLVEPKLYAAAKPEVRNRIVGTERNGETGNSKHKVIKTSYLGMLSLTDFLGPLYREQDT